MINPVKELKEEQGWTIQQLAAAANVGFTTAYQNIKGSTCSMNGNILQLFERLGYDLDRVTEEYQRFREEQREELISQAG